MPQHFIKDSDPEADDIFLKLQRLTSDDEILLDHPTPLSEVVEIWDPNTHSYIPSLV